MLWFLEVLFCVLCPIVNISHFGVKLTFVDNTFVHACAIRTPHANPNKTTTPVTETWNWHVNQRVWQAWPNGQNWREIWGKMRAFKWQLFWSLLVGEHIITPHHRFGWKKKSINFVYFWEQKKIQNSFYVFSCGFKLYTPQEQQTKQKRFNVCVLVLGFNSSIKNKSKQFLTFERQR